MSNNNEMARLWQALKPFAVRDLAVTPVSGSSSSTSGGTDVSNAALVTVAPVSTLNNERYLAVSSALSLVDGGGGSALTIGLSTPGVLNVSSTSIATGAHTHGVTSSSAPGAAASLLASSGAGNLTLPTFTASTKLTSPLIDTASGNLSLVPAGYIYVSTGTDEQLRLDSISAVGNPFVSFYQTNVRRSFIQHNDTGDTLRLVSEYGNISLLPGTAGTAGETVLVTPSGAAVTGVLSASTKLTTPLIDTASGDLTLSPAGLDVILNTSVNLVSSNYVTETAGFRLPSSGAADILSVTTNELTSRQSLSAGAAGFNVLFHTHDYDHVHVLVNHTDATVDDQFGVDIDDNLLVRGYIVGKHAIQLPGAMMICHYDGTEPYETNYTGNPMGHMGQVGTESGGVTYRPGKFGKAISVAEATTNIISNPSFELNDNGWTGDYGTGSTTRSGLIALYGTYSLAMTATLANYAWYNNIGNVENGESMTISIYFLGAGSATIYLYDLTASTSRASDTDTSDTATWKRLVASWTNNTGSAKSMRFILEVDTASATIYWDGAQAERKAYATPYCDGSLEPLPGGTGHTWAGTAQSSASSRTAASVVYDAYTTLSPDAITAGCWVRRSGNKAGYIVSHPAISIEFL